MKSACFLVPNRLMNAPASKLACSAISATVSLVNDFWRSNTFKELRNLASVSAALACLGGWYPVAFKS
jgi:hypothetical protein